MRELQFIRAGRLEWRERPDPVLRDPHDAIVRPFVATRCDGDTMPIHRPVPRAMQLGMRTGLIDPIVGSICGPVPFRGPFAIGHEAIAEVGYYLPPGTKVPLMHMYANDATLHIGVSHVRPVLLDFIARTDFPAEHVTPMLADWDDAPQAYTSHTTKLVPHRPPLDATT